MLRHVKSSAPTTPVDISAAIEGNTLRTPTRIGKPNVLAGPATDSTVASTAVGSAVGNTMSAEQTPVVATGGGDGGDGNDMNCDPRTGTKRRLARELDGAAGEAVDGAIGVEDAVDAGGSGSGDMPMVISENVVIN